MGFFTKLVLDKPDWWDRRNPFQGGMGFFTPWPVLLPAYGGRVAIPFRVGWGFSPHPGPADGDPHGASQSLSGWDGVFHMTELKELEELAKLGRNPFQGGMGFFTVRGG